MDKISTLSFAAMIALGSFTLSLQAVEDPHAAQAAQGGQAPEGQPPGGPGAHGGGMHEMMMQQIQGIREHLKKEHKGYADVVLKYTNELKLSDEQIGKITRIHQANQEKMEQLGPKLHKTLKAAHEAFLNPSSDEAAIRKVAREHSTVFDELVETALKSRNEINALLTPEQLKQLQSKNAAP